MKFMVKDIKCAAMPTSPAYQNCTFNETSFTEVFDKPELVSKTRWNLWPIEFGWKKGQGFKSINDWTYIKDLEIIQMQSQEYRFQAQILKDLELDLLRLPAFQTPSTVLIKTIRLLGPLAQLEQLDV
jgi:hypothetical protein